MRRASYMKKVIHQATNYFKTPSVLSKSFAYCYLKMQYPKVMETIKLQKMFQYYQLSKNVSIFKCYGLTIKLLAFWFKRHFLYLLINLWYQWNVCSFTINFIININFKTTINLHIAITHR